MEIKGAQFGAAVVDGGANDPHARIQLLHMDNDGGHWLIYGRPFSSVWLHDLIESLQMLHGSMHAGLQLDPSGGWLNRPIIVSDEVKVGQVYGDINRIPVNGVRPPDRRFRVERITDGEATVIILGPLDQYIVLNVPNVGNGKRIYIDCRFLPSEHHPLLEDADTEQPC